MIKSVSILLDELLDLQNEYMTTYRATTLMHKIKQPSANSIINFDDIDVRESLISHIGHLPIIAAHLHPFVQHTANIDLGRALVMLSIHDIGETVTGDIMTYHKTTTDALKEEEITKNILHPNYLNYFVEYEAMETLDSRFAKSIDRIAPLFHDINLGVLLPRRMSHFGFSIDNVIKKNARLWNGIRLY